MANWFGDGRGDGGIVLGDVGGDAEWGLLQLKYCFFLDSCLFKKDLLPASSHA